MNEERVTYGPGFHDDVPERVYHSDPCERPALSSSIGHTLLSKSPLHAYMEHPKLGAVDRQATKPMEDGTLVHSLLLGGSAPVIIDAANYKTKLAQEIRDAARDSGQVPVLAREWEIIQKTADVLRQKLADRGIDLSVGRKEVTMVWESEGVLNRGRVDYLPEPVIVYDLKKTQSAHPRAVRAAMEDYGYAMQLAAYRDAIETLRPELVGRVKTLCIFMELDAPHCITIAEPDPTMRQLGEMRWRRAQRVWRRCLETDNWPEYVEGIYRVEARPWTLEEEMAASHNEEMRE